MDQGLLIVLTAISGGVMIPVVAIIGGFIVAAAKRRQFEHSRREIAAYIAEGTMSPDEGRALLKIGACKDK